MDLIFVNNAEYISNIDMCVNSKFSDHNLIFSTVNMDEVKDDNDTKKNFCQTNIPLYNLDSEEGWATAIEWFNDKNLENVNIDELVLMVEKMVSENFQLRSYKKVNKEGKEFKSNNNIPRDIRILFRQKRKLSKKLYKVKTQNRCVRALQELRSVEERIRDADFKRKLKKENEAISKMKENPAYFYTYTKNLRKCNSKIGPLTDDKNRVINRPISDILQDQYSSVWSTPSDKYKVENPKEFFRTAVKNEPKEVLFKKRFTKEKVIKAIEKLNKSAAAGPDGLDNNILYKLREVLAGPLYKIFQDSIDDGTYL